MSNSGSDSKTRNSLTPLVEVMNKLLSPNGCPWDLEQTHQSLAPFAIEEAHELAEAIEFGDMTAVKEELGDFLFQTVFHSALAQKEGLFDLNDVITTVCEKLIRRHPHVFGDVKVENSDDVLKNWNAIKKEEKKDKKKKIFDMPVSMPALQRAQKIGDKTKNLKFDWDNADQVFEKVKEEVLELTEAVNAKSLPEIQEELGDLFFALAQLARHLKFDAESAARQANKKFELRFDKMMALAESRNLDFTKLSTEEKEILWQEIKKQKN